MGACLIDANFFIQHRHFVPMDIFPSFWSSLGKVLVDGDALVHDSVYKELARQQDVLVPWLKEQGIKPMSTSSGALERYLELCEWANSSKRYTEEATRVFTDSDRADIWLCAEALASGLSIVSYETRSNSRNRIKIPNVCEEFGISCINGYDFMRERKFCF